MNVKLNKSIREDIVEAALHFAFAKKAEKLEKAGHALAIKVLHHLIGAENLRLYKKVPVGWFQGDNDISFHMGGQSHRMLFGKYVPVPQRIIYGTDGNDVSVTSPLGEELTDHFRALEDLKTNSAQLKAELEALVASVPTVSKLEAIWPEGKGFIPEYTKTVAHPPPAIVVANLNEKLQAFAKAG